MVRCFFNDAGVGLNTRTRFIASISALSLAVASAPARAYNEIPPGVVVELNVKCDGVTNITAAVNAAMVQGATNRLPEGRCIVTGSVIEPANTILIGAGPGLTIIDASSGKPGMGPVVRLNGSNAQLRDLSVKGNGAATTLASALSAGATSLTVASGTGWPTSGPFKAVLFGDGANASETLNVTTVSGTTWTVAATTGAHGAGALIQSPRLDDGVYVGLNLLHNSIVNIEASGAGDNGIETDGSDTKYRLITFTTTLRMEYIT